MAPHVFLESCAHKEVGICFVGECWVALTCNGTQSHPDYVMLGSASIFFFFSFYSHLTPHSPTGMAGGLICTPTRGANYIHTKQNR